MTGRRYANSGFLKSYPMIRWVVGCPSRRANAELERLSPIWETMKGKVDPFVLAKLLNDPRSAQFLSIYTRECREAVDALTNVVQFYAYGKEFALASSFGLTDSNETFLVSCRIR